MDRLSEIVMVLLALVGVTTRLATGQGVVDVKAAERAIIKADEAFCQATIDRNRNRFLAVIAEDATFGQPGAQLHGRDAVAKGWAPYFQPGGPTLARWHSLVAVGRVLEWTN